MTKKLRAECVKKMGMIKQLECDQEGKQDEIRKEMMGKENKEDFDDLDHNFSGAMGQKHY